MHTSARTTSAEFGPVYERDHDRCLNMRDAIDSLTPSSKVEGRENDSELYDRRERHE